MPTSEQRLITKSKLINDLKALGLRPGDVVMLHVSVKAIGWIVGGPDVVLQALFEALTPVGTLMMYVGWEDDPHHFPTCPPEWQQAYWEECPPFDPARSRAKRSMSILTEYLRTWPGAYRSQHPEASVAAVGTQAAWLTENHPLRYGYGDDTPLDKLCQVGGKVLLLGAPLSAITLLHHAEHRANVPHKRITRYPMPILRDGQRVWIEIEEFDTDRGIVDWGGEIEMFEQIARDFLASGQGRVGKVGAAQSYLFDAPALVKFGVQWLERIFG